MRVAEAQPEAALPIGSCGFLASGHPVIVPQVEIQDVSLSGGLTATESKRFSRVIQRGPIVVFARKNPPRVNPSRMDKVKKRWETRRYKVRTFVQYCFNEFPFRLSPVIERVTLLYGTLGVQANSAHSRKGLKLGPALIVI